MNDCGVTHYVSIEHVNGSAMSQKFVSREHVNGRAMSHSLFVEST